MFEFVQRTPESRDCTCGYNIELDKEYTLKEFIGTVLKEKSNEWGEFVIYNGESLWKSPRWEYKWGETIV